MKSITSIAMERRKIFEGYWPLIVAMLDTDSVVSVHSAVEEQKVADRVVNIDAGRTASELLRMVESGRCRDEIPLNPKTTEEQDAAALGQKILQWFLNLF